MQLAALRPAESITTRMLRSGDDTVTWLQAPPLHLKAPAVSGFIRKHLDQIAKSNSMSYSSEQGADLQDGLMCRYLENITSRYSTLTYFHPAVNLYVSAAKSSKSRSHPELIRLCSQI
ncbi:hypothetical protein XENOCAPTIV_013623 [Xenoophorus captivus]|uniref:Uncharacterized protein n=1 Tax=Xenoophorus captivus TaxID=1517983 RepID=A0ABV0R075_9TELE